MTNKTPSSSVDDDLVDGIHRRIPGMFRDSVTTKKKTTREVDMLRIKVIVHKAEELPAMDHIMGFIPDKSDPYCSVLFLPRGPTHRGQESVLSLGKTHVDNHTVNPIWEQYFSVTVPRREVLEDALFQLRLYDKDQDSKDDFMGLVRVPLFDSNDPSTLRETHTDWYPVQQSINAKSKQLEGRLQCTIKLEQFKEKICQVPDIQQYYFGLQLTVSKAEGLKVSDDWLGIPTSSDPYVIVSLVQPHKKRPRKMGQTEFIPRSVNPVWNEVFATQIPIDELDRNAWFQLEIMDRDDEKEDDLLGVVKIPLKDYLRKVKPDNPTFSSVEWFEVSPDSAPNAQGTVRCKLSINFFLAGGETSDQS